MQPLRVIWDLEDDPDGNVQHIAAHGITQAEVEEVLLQSGLPVEYSNSTGRPTVKGRTVAGREIRVVFEWDEEDDFIYPVTAFDV